MDEIVSYFEENLTLEFMVIMQNINCLFSLHPPPLMELVKSLTWGGLFKIWNKIIKRNKTTSRLHTTPLRRGDTTRHMSEYSMQTIT